MKLPSFSISPGAILIGAGAVLLTPIVLPTVAGVLRSVTKVGMKTAMLSYDKGKQVVTDATTAVSDVTSEAKSEVFGGPKKQPKKSAAAS
jgi:hypothetical protein